ncbi:MAG: response regulator transcription factor [Ignavibacteriae bacterium]|nr:response regulator transcription factor [Ignavibacteriota bacterium]MCB0746180.1 response regulator transcription factor [Ignavibacteriota bacterium]MCB0750487.1 response regulator transcription factor [Ignavibacteriota bacterium]MCB9250489.1 response regulator transcription factor [Ignavibacteriales bacterium]
MAKSLKKIRILLIEDNRLLRDGIEAILKKQTDMTVVATFSNGENIRLTMKNLKPNIVILDLGLRNRNSLQIVKSLTKNFPKTKIIVMDLIPLQTDIYEYVQAGVSGFMLKDINVKEFLNTIRGVYEGVKVLPPNLTGSLFSQIVEHALNESKTPLVDDSVKMTKREKQVVELIADGFTNKEIAQQLHLSTYTVKSHVHNILEKLALNTRVQIAKHAHFSNAYKSTSDSNNETLIN